MGGSVPTPYYQDDLVTLYHGDARLLMPDIAAKRADPMVMLTDPPYGFEYKSNRPRNAGNERSIAGDRGTFLRDAALSWWDDRPALVFGSRKSPEPYGVRQVLVWDQGDALGMGDPWDGRRDTGSVIRCSPVQSMGRLHPNEKPVDLLRTLLGKCIDGTVVDPFAGSGSTLVAAKSLNRHAIGIEVDEAYCAKAADRLRQDVLGLAVPA